MYSSYSSYPTIKLQYPQSLISTSILSIKLPSSSIMKERLSSSKFSTNFLSLALGLFLGLVYHMDS